MAKELERDAVITKFIKEYFPVFQFHLQVMDKEQIIVKPAKGTTLPGMQNLSIPPGNLIVFDSTASTDGAEILTPDLSIGSYLPELPGKALDQSIVYFPVYEITYTFKEETYGLLVNPVFFVLVIAGFFAGNILGTKPVQKVTDPAK